MATAGVDFFLMANLEQECTGLPFIVWISVRGNARHDVRVKVSRGLKAIPSELVSVAIRPDIRVVNGKISGSDLALLRRWIELNQDVIVRYWNSEIGTMDALRAIRSI